MTIDVFWRLPLSGDGRSIAASDWHRGDHSSSRPPQHAFARTGEPRDGYTYYDQLLSIARAAEIAGFDGLWIPESPGGEEPLIVAGSLAREVARLRLVTTFRPALLSAVYATKIANSFQRLTGNRLAWNLVSDSQAEGQQWHGRNWTEAEQIRRAGEFLDVAKGFWHTPPFTYQGVFYEVVDGGFAPALQGQVFPKVYLSGTSDEALALSAKHADVHIFPLGPVEEVRARITHLAELAAAHGRTLGYGLEIDLLAHYDRDHAWAEARREWEELRTRGAAGSARRLSSSFEATRVGEHLWAGFGALRPGQDLGLVGAFDDVVQALDAYAAVGVTTFVLGAHPHLEEAYRVGEHVLPFVRKRTGAQARAAS